MFFREFRDMSTAHLQPVIQYRYIIKIKNVLLFSARIDQTNQKIYVFLLQSLCIFIVLVWLQYYFFCFLYSVYYNVCNIYTCTKKKEPQQFRLRIFLMCIIIIIMCLVIIFLWKWYKYVMIFSKGMLVFCIKTISHNDIWDLSKLKKTFIYV